MGLWKSPDQLAALPKLHRPAVAMLLDQLDRLIVGMALNFDSVPNMAFVIEIIESITRHAFPPHCLEEHLR